jgi:hypothetical protein
MFSSVNTPASFVSMNVTALTMTVFFYQSLITPIVMVSSLFATVRGLIKN